MPGHKTLILHKKEPGDGVYTSTARQAFLFPASPSYSWIEPMHRSAAPDKTQRKATARREGAAVSHQEQDETSRHGEHQGAGNDERGRYGSADQSGTSDQVKPKQA